MLMLKHRHFSMHTVIPLKIVDFKSNSFVTWSINSPRVVADDLHIIGGDAFGNLLRKQSAGILRC